MHRLIDQNSDIDIISLAGCMPTQETSRIASLTDNVTPISWEYHEQQIVEAYQRRIIEKACSEVLESPHLGAAAAVSSLCTTIDTLESFSDYSIKNTAEILQGTSELIEAAYHRDGDIQGITSGIHLLDDTTLGFQPRRLYIFGARPSQGKTALMMNFIAATDRPVGVISAESSYKELGKRLFSLKGEINSMKVNSGLLSRKDLASIQLIQDELSVRGIFIYDEPNMSIDTLVIKAREMKRRHGIEILFVDYLQQIRSSQSQKRHEQVAEVSIKLKNLSRNLDIPIVALAQLRRDSENKRPHLSDLGDSGQIERDADFAAFIYKEVHESSGTIDLSINHWLLVLKNRDGITRDVPVTFIPKHYLFKDRELQVNSYV